MKGRGENFPGTSRTNGLNSNLLFAKFGQDLGFSAVIDLVYLGLVIR